MNPALERIRGAEVFSRLSRSGKNGGGSGGLLHHGARIVLALGLAALVTALFPRSQGVEVTGYEIGSVATEDVIAQFPFEVPKDPDDLERDRDAAAAAVPATFDFDPDAANRMVSALTDLFDRIGPAAQGEDASSAGARVRSLMDGEGITLTDEQTAILLDSETREQLLEAARGTVQDVLPVGVAEGISSQVRVLGQIRVRNEGSAVLLPLTDVVGASELYTRAAERLPASLATAEVETLLRLILIRSFRPSLVENAVETQREQDDARSAVPTEQARIVLGEAIVRSNQQIGEPELARLLAYQEEQRNRGLTGDAGWSASAALGSLLQALLIILVYGVVLFQFRREIYNNFRWLLVHAALIAVYVLLAAVIGNRGLSAEMLPIAFVALTVGLLWDGRIALVLALVVTLLTAAFPTFVAESAIPITLAGGAAAALTVRTVRRRSQAWIFIAVIAAGYAVMLLAVTLLGLQPWSAMVGSLLGAGLSAASNAILAMGVLPILEWFTGITTDQTLLEWADPNRPLLGRLSREAPGTYAHTIGVANLAESAANAIGANGLLCRVGTYYHDVGKVLRPGYFIENQRGGRNPHQRISAATSAAIVREHVTEGLKLAREHGVPPVIRDFIAEHHGTQRIGFFYEQALEDAGDEDPPAVEDFTYPGPRPRSRETAILMFSDSIESATRALQDPTVERIGDLVDSIVAAKIADGQLDDAPLTQREIALLKEEFTKMLAGMYHTRIDYPQTRHLTEAPSGSPAETTLAK